MTATAREFVALALAQVGDRYVFGAEVSTDDPDPDEWDCSALVLWAARRLGLSYKQVPDGSWNQYAASVQANLSCSPAHALQTAGALLFVFDGDPLAGRRPKRAHVAISLGDGRVVEARSVRLGVGVWSGRDRGWTHAGHVPGLDYGPAQVVSRERAPVTVELPLLAMGDRGPLVRAIQGILDIEVDGAFGPDTRGAVKSLQRMRGLSSDGIVGPETWRLLFQRAVDSTPRRVRFWDKDEGTP